MKFLLWLKSLFKKEEVTMPDEIQAVDNQETEVKTWFKEVFTETKKLIDQYGDHLKVDALRLLVEVKGKLPNGADHDLVKFYDTAKDLVEKFGDIDAAIKFATAASALPAQTETAVSEPQAEEQPQPAEVQEPEPLAEPESPAETEQPAQ